MALISPGIEILEKNYTETTGATGDTVGAHAGLFTWGAVNYPQFVSSETVLRQKFGVPNPYNVVSFYNAKNYLDYSTSMWNVRIGTSACRNAVATKSGGIENIHIQNVGSGYTVTPKVIISNPGNSDGIQATAEAVLSGAPITTYNILNGGSGYSVGDIIILSNPEETVDVYETVVDTSTGLSQSILTSSEIHVAKAKVSVVSANGSIQTITFVGDGLTFGMGYVNADIITYTIFNSTGAVTSNGVGANLEFSVGTSSIKKIDVTTEGMGYTDEQNIIVLIEVDPDLQSNFTGVAATAIPYIKTTGAKIYNEQVYQDSWADGQGSYGIAAAKYPGELGNSIAIAMCDGDNWETQINGVFYARSSVEEKENKRELAYVRRIVDTDDVFDNAPLDNKKVLRTNTGKVLGVVDSKIDSEEFYLVELSTNATYDVQIDQFVKIKTYNVSNLVKSVSRTTDGVVTVRTNTNHGLVAGQYVSVNVRHATTVNVKNVEIISTTNDTFKYATNYYRAINTVDETGTISSDAMGRVDGFFKFYDAKNDSYKLSKKQFYLTLNNGNDIVDLMCLTTANTSIVKTTSTESIKVGAVVYNNPYIPIASKVVSILDATTFVIDSLATETSVETLTKFNNPNPIGYNVNDTLVDTNGELIGKIAKISKVQTILMSTISDNDVYGETVKSEWKYKSLFARKPTTTSYTASKGGSNDEIHVVIIDENGQIMGESGTVIERLASLSKASDNPLYYKPAINNKSNWVWSLDHPYEVETSNERKDWGSTANSGKFKSLSNSIYKSLSGGVDTIDPTASDYLDGYKLFADSAEYLIDTFMIGYLGANTTNAIIDNVLNKRRDATGSISPPLMIGTSDDIALAIVEYRNALSSTSYAAISSSWKYQYDKYTNQYIWTPCAADVSGTFAYTDSISASWKSPAGLTRGLIKNVTKLSFNPTQPQRDILYAAGVDPIVTFPGEGTCLFGDKNLLNVDNAFAYIPVRRLFTELERKISKASRSKLFEDNNAFTRSQFVATVEPYLRDIKGRGGIEGFLIKCDEENNGPDVLNNHKFIGDIYIKPNNSINYITLNFIAVKSGIDFSEISL